MKNLKALKDFLGYDDSTPSTKELATLLVELVNSVDEVEGYVEGYVSNNKTLKLDLRAIKRDEDHGEDQLLRDTKENVVWLKKAREFLATGMKEIRQAITNSDFFYDGNKAFLKAILKLSNTEQLVVYLHSTWI